MRKYALRRSQAANTLLGGYMYLYQLEAYHEKMCSKAYSGSKYSCTYISWRHVMRKCALWRTQTANTLLWGYMYL